MNSLGNIRSTTVKIPCCELCRDRTKLKAKKASAMYNFKKEAGDWTRYLNFPNHKEFDLHRPDLQGAPPYGWKEPCHKRMATVYENTLRELKAAYQSDTVEHLIIRHGDSTSRMGKITSRSQVRKLVNSPDATPYIIRSKCIQHPTVFVAAIRPHKASLGTKQ